MYRICAAGITLVVCSLLFVSCASDRRVDTSLLSKEKMSASQRVQVFLVGQEHPQGYEFLSSITGYSESYIGNRRVTTKGDALEQARVKCLQAGGNALINVTFASSGYDGIDIFTCSGDAVKLKQP